MTYEQAAKKAERRLAKNNYHLARAKVCLSCSHAHQQDIESELECDLLAGISDEWAVQDVGELHVCDSWSGIPIAAPAVKEKQ